MEQPKWCDYPNATRPFFGCWSLLDGLVKDETFCKKCDCYIRKIMITEDYVSFETAKLLKEKGFDEPCIWLYSKKGEKHYASDYHSPWSNSELAADEWSCCTQAVVMKWLRRKECVICVIPLTFYFGENVSSWGYNVWAGDNLEVDEDNTPKFTTYEEACEAAIKYCLENLI